MAGKVYNGFELKKEKYIKEIESDVMVFEHVKSGAKLVYVKNDDDNKVFSITFRTPMCAMPLAPPPLSTTPTFLRWAGRGCALRRAGIKSRQTAIVVNEERLNRFMFIFLYLKIFYIKNKNCAKMV